MVRIVTDSASDLPPQIAKEMDITVVPMYLHFGAESYRDNVDLNTEDFYRKLETSHVFPRTSAPGPGIWANFFTKLANEASELLVVTAGSSVSASYESALQAKATVKTNCRIEVVDSTCGVGGEMLLAILAANLAKKGLSLDEVYSTMKRAAPKASVLVAFDTLEYLRRGGRIGRAQALLGSLLKVNPIIRMKDGKIFPYGRARSRAQVMNILVDFVKSFTRIENIAVEDATTPDELQILIERLKHIVPEERIYRSKVSPVVGAHVGPHALAVSVLEMVD